MDVWLLYIDDFLKQFLHYPAMQKVTFTKFFNELFIISKMTHNNVLYALIIE